LRTRAATSTVLAFCCLMTPSPIEGMPLKRAIVRSSSAPTLTSATSPSRITWAPRCATTIAANSSGRARSPRVRTANSRPWPSTRPDGISAFSARSARSMSATVRS
jgi:hypothetical protein